MSCSKKVDVCSNQSPIKSTQKKNMTTVLSGFFINKRKEARKKQKQEFNIIWSSNFENHCHYQHLKTHPRQKPSSVVKSKKLTNKTYTIFKNQQFHGSGSLRQCQSYSFRLHLFSVNVSFFDFPQQKQKILFQFRTMGILGKVPDWGLELG